MRALLLALLFSTAAQAEPWTTEQKVLGATGLALLAADYGQTRTISRDGWTEYNPLLGRHPSLGRVNAYFAAVPLVSYLVLDALPSEQRTRALYVMTLIEGGVVGRNAYLGIHMRF